MKKIFKMLMVTVIGCFGFAISASAEEYGTEFQKFASDGSITITSNKFDLAAGGKGELVSHYLTSWNQLNKTRFVLGLCDGTYETCTIVLNDENGGIAEQHDIQIKYEEKYSDQFKKLTADGSLTVNGSTISDKTLFIYAKLNSYETDDYTYVSSGCNEDKSICDIVLYQKIKENGVSSTVEVERHAINIKYTNIVSDQFKQLTVDGNLTVNGSTIGDKSNLIYTKLNSYETDDYSYMLGTCNEGKTTCDIVLYKRIKNNNSITLKEMERHAVNIKYTDVVSDQFKQLTADGNLTVNGSTIGDKMSLLNYVIGTYNTNDYSYSVSMCNEDKTRCDIVLKQYIREGNSTRIKEIERHAVNMKYTNTVSEEFKKNIPNGTITVNGTTIGEKRNLINDTLSLYATPYSEENRYYYYVNQCNEDSSICDVVLQKTENKDGNYHSYTIDYQAVKIKYTNTTSEQFKQDVGDTITLHGTTIDENKRTLVYNYINSLTQDKKFTYTADRCNEDGSSCDIVLRFVDNDYNTIGIERHVVKIVYGEEQFSDTFKTLTNNKQLVVKSVKPTSVEEADLLIGAYLKTFGTENDYFYVSGCNEEYSICDVVSSKTGETHSLNITYETNLDANISKIVSDMVAKFPENKGFILEDLELLNYFVSKNYTSSRFGDESTMLNFSSETKAYLGNMTGILDTRMGMGGPFGFSSWGGFAIAYNNTIYAVINRGGMTATNVIYIPDTTEDTVEAYITAAQKRINNYLKNETVKVTYGGKVSELADAEYIEDLGFDASKVIDYYEFTYNNVTSQYLIVKDSSKIKEEVEYKNNDIVTGISISTTSADVPLDTTIQATEIPKESQQYQEITSRLKVKEAVIYDLKLFSSTTKQFISKLENGLFQVRIPIPESMLNKDLAAYYIREDGKIEEHPITVMDGHAHFTTDHFSVYTITEKIESEDVITEKVPNTYDGITNYVGLGMVGLIGLSITGFTYKRKENK